MASLTLLPRTFLHRTRWGTTIFYDRRQGLLARDEAGRWHPIAAEELRRGFPEAYAAWLWFAAILPIGMAAKTVSQRGDGGHAA
jgi:hypothetical protein